MTWKCVNCGQYSDLGDCCYDCACRECDRCDKTIDFDDDLSAWQVYSEDSEPARRDAFPDGAMKVHYECLTIKEKALHDKNY